MMLFSLFLLFFLPRSTASLLVWHVTRPSQFSLVRDQPRIRNIASFIHRSFIDVSTHDDVTVLRTETDKASETRSDPRLSYERACDAAPSTALVRVVQPLGFAGVAHLVSASDFQ